MQRRTYRRDFCLRLRTTATRRVVRTMNPSAICLSRRAYALSTHVMSPSNVDTKTKFTKKKKK